MGWVRARRSDDNGRGGAERHRESDRENTGAISHGRVAAPASRQRFTPATKCAPDNADIVLRDWHTWNQLFDRDALIAAGARERD